MTYCIIIVWEGVTLTGIHEFSPILQSSYAEVSFALHRYSPHALISHHIARLVLYGSYTNITAGTWKSHSTRAWTVFVLLQALCSPSSNDFTNLSLACSPVWHTWCSLCTFNKYGYLSRVLQKGIPVICEGLSGVIGEAGELKMEQ